MAKVDSILVRDHEAGRAERFSRSAAATEGVTSTAEALAWLSESRRTHRYDVRLIPFDRLDGWGFAPGTGELSHAGGGFFTVQGLHVRTDTAQWMQPIINQWEIGILGLLVRDFDGVPHFLMQAKMEPGNLNTVQLSPTVQATRSNYTGVHRGRLVRHIEHFTGPATGRVLVDSLQSEQGSWFLRKRNRNMVVEATRPVEAHEDFRWLTLGQIHHLLTLDNVVNMDARSVLACTPRGVPRGPHSSAYQQALAASATGERAVLGSTGVLSWLCGVRSHRELRQWTRPLSTIKGWHRTEDEIAHDDGRFFRIVAADIVATSREVSRWTQPLLAPVGQGVSGLIVRSIDGVLHLLVHARVEAGLADVAEIGPTVQCSPDNYRGLPADRRPRYLEDVLEAPADRVRFDAVQSEEGGRFLHAENRYRIVEAPAGFPIEVPADFAWITLHQVMRLVQHHGYVNVQARTLVAALMSTI